MTRPLRLFSSWMLVTVVACLLTSCSDKASETKSVLETTVSWASSAEMVVQARSEDTAPAGYAMIALDSCKREISSLRTQLETLGSDEAVLATIDGVTASIVEVRRSIGGDAETLSTRLLRLRDAVAILKSKSGSQ